MNEMEDMQLKLEIDAIMERVKRIMQDVDSVNGDPKETTQQTEEQ